jgi:hypothetical protein
MLQGCDQQLIFSQIQLVYDAVNHFFMKSVVNRKNLPAFLREA